VTSPAPSPFAARILAAPWRRLRDFGGWSADATYLWPRWLLLRAIGLVFILVFAGIVDDGRALVGPQGLVPVGEFCAKLREIFPHALERFLRAPTLFWISSNAGFAAFLPWCGLAAAVALVLNLAPRLALFVCWAVLLSFVAVWQIFSPTIIDQLMLETALLCIPFAPAGWRPGLGPASPPRPIAVFMLRWLLFRIMFESGCSKLFAGDPRWRDFTVLQALHETNPSPTILAYFDYHLPRIFHVGQILLTYVAELAAPLLAVFGGRRGRWFALAAWVALQAGIQLTGNFGWLNTAAIALGVLLLDDQMLAGAARALGWSRAAGALAPPDQPLAGASRWTRIVAGLLGLHLLVGLHAFLITAAAKPAPVVPALAARPVDYLFRDFHSANAYIPFATFPAVRYELEFAGSNDDGVTWRTYPYRYKPSREDRMSPFLAPRFGRFDAAMQLALLQNSPVVPRVAEQLLRRNPDVMRLFAGDPFPDHPPGVVRMEVFRFAFTDRTTQRQTGRYWIKQFAGDLRPALILDAQGCLHQDGEAP
jgi:hypothetical protein